MDPTKVTYFSNFPSRSDQSGCHQNEIKGVFSYILGCFPNHSFELCPMDGCDEILIARHSTGRVAQMGCQKLR